MYTRRKFLRTISIGAFAPALFVGKSVSPLKSIWEMFFSDREIEYPKFRPDPAAWSDSTINAAWIGHATVLINFFGTNIITDPLFAKSFGLNVFGMFTVGSNRLIAPAISIKKLPRIDLILISHAHMDHLDIPSLGKFDYKTPIILAKNTSDIVSGMEWENLHELDWGEKLKIGSLEIEALRVKHFGWRYPWESDRSKGNNNGRSFNAYLLTKNGHSIVFGGDTAYHEYFKEIGKRNINIDLAIMPIGAYNPWISVHTNPEQAVEMSDFLGARYILPIHWRTFIQGYAPLMEPIKRLKSALKDTPDRIALDSVGQTWTLNKMNN
jgi:L-ascorbate metabolism protein UlaG (beta-lactamase superfamily)